VWPEIVAEAFVVQLRFRHELPKVLHQPLLQKLNLKQKYFSFHYIYVTALNTLICIPFISFQQLANNVA
jgi:hypothetical protein